MESNCNNVLTLPQFGPTCWFNALMMTLFYSQGMRNVMFTVNETWKSNIKYKKIAYETFSDILQNRYLKNATMNSIHPEHILQLLHKIDSKKFYYNIGEHIGGWGQVYLTSILKFLCLDKSTIFFRLTKMGKTLFGEYIDYDVEQDGDIVRLYSHLYAPLSFEKDNHPKMIALDINDNKIDFSYNYGMLYKNKRDDYYGEFNSKTNSLTYNGFEYIIDSLYIGNFNDHECNMGHAIACVTCGSTKYVYNGWSKQTDDAGFGDKIGATDEPCSLMKHDWIKDSTELCINTRLCKMDRYVGDLKKQMCFNFKKGKRLYFAVRKDIYEMKNTNTKLLVTKKSLANLIKHDTPVPKCPHGYQEQPYTKACIKCKTNKTEMHQFLNVCLDDENKKVKPIHVIERQFLKQPEKTQSTTKECPPGKVINPITNRCNKMKSTTKECPPGKVLNVVTNRCKKAK